MNPKIYKEYLKAVDLGIKGEKYGYLNEIIEEEKDSNNLILTIKNYRIKTGLSYRIHFYSEREDYMIKGPMGKGL
jgi:hypothetical protein